MRAFRHASLLSLICLCLLTACATDPQVQRHEIGAVSKLTAESTYQAIYTFYKDGKVSEEVMAHAGQVYLVWLVAQQLYVDMSRRGVEDVTEVRQGVAQALEELLFIAAEAGAL